MTPFRWYLGSMMSALVANGMQLILFTWLVTVVLHEPADRIGIAQMLLAAPSIVFMLLGGAIADRADCRALLIRYHLIAAAPPLALAALIGAGALSYPGLLVFGVLAGTLGALVIPARDAILTRIVPSGLARAIAVTMAAQYAAQLAGIVVAGAANRVGAVALLLLQAVLAAVGALGVARLAPAPPRSRHASGQGRAAAMLDGFRVAMRFPTIQPMIVVMLAVGVFYVGPFMVLLPLLVRDAYAGGSAELAIINLCFWGGTIGSTMAQVRLPEFRRPGRAVVVALSGGAVVLAAMSRPVPFYGLAALCLVWGIGAGVTMTQGRTTVQLAAPETHRARILALFQMGMFGGGPIGALVIGYVAKLVGPHEAAVYPAIAMVVVIATLVLRSGIWRQKQTPVSVGAPLYQSAR